MRIGLGSTATSIQVIERLAERIRTEGLKVTGVASSEATSAAAAAAGIPMSTLDEIDRLDLVIDGADEIDPQKNLIKDGTSGNVYERILAAAGKELIVVADEKNLVPVLAKARLLPVEVAKFGWRQTERLVAATGCKPQRRERDGAPFVTECDNFVLDCKYDGIEDPAWLDSQLNSLTGVIDHGLFVGVAGRIIVATAQGKVRVIP
jgi:ribose 5-phosphate isomerase A